MATIAVIGATTVAAPYALAGAQVYCADDAASVRAAWDALPTATAVVVLSASAAGALAGEVHGRHDLLTVTLP